MAGHARQKELEIAERRRGFSLRLKLTLLALAVSTVPIALVGSILIDINQEAMEQSLREHFVTIVDDVSRDIVSGFARTRDDLDAIARILADSKLDVDARIEVARAQIAASESITAVGIYGEDGRRIDAVSEGSLQASDDAGSEEGSRGARGDGGPAGPSPVAMPEVLDRALAAEALERGRAVGKAELVAGTPSVLLILPIRGAKATWLAACHVSLGPVQARIERFDDRRIQQRVYELFVVDEDLRALAHSDRERADSLASIAGNPILADIDPAVIDKDFVVFRELAGDRLGVGVGHEKGHGGLVAAIGAVPDLPWAVAVSLPRDIAYASFVRMRYWVIGAVAGLILLATLAAVFVARRITAPVRALVGFAQDLAARRFERRVAIATRDELGVLGTALSDAAMQLEESERRVRDELALRSDLGRYLPEKLVDQVVERQQTMALGGQRRRITVLFADVVGFTAVAESHAAEEVVTILGELFTLLTEVIFRHDGTVDKFVGDCVMAFWGAPDADPDHAAKAVAAAEDMLGFLDVGNQSWEKKYGVRIELAIGVNTGEAVVGNFGSKARMEYTVIGDVVNVAARLATIARPQQILTSEATCKAAGDGFDYLAIGEQALAGDTREVELYEVCV